MVSLLIQLNVPYGLIAIFISLCFFYYFKQKAEIRKQQRRNKIEEKQQALLQQLTDANKENTQNMQ